MTPHDPVDPASLSGEALDRWYRRSPDEIEAERQAQAQQRYNEFFDSGVLPNSISATEERDWFPNAVGQAGTGYVVRGADKAGAFDRGYRDTTTAAPDQGYLTLVGNPANRRMRREHEREIGPWPRDEQGRNYDVAHIRAIADGGTNTLDNIRPLQREAHIREHQASGDFGRWGKRPWTARAFGGSVAKALGPLSILPDIAGIVSGRIRTDSFDNFVSDLSGWPSQEDHQKEFERQQKAINRNWKPGDSWVL